MANKCLKVSDAAIYRRVSDELVVIQLETGNFFYFNMETESFLESFKKARRLQEQIEDGKSEEANYLREFCDFLLENKILSEDSSDDADDLPSIDQESRPAFLRKGDKTLDEITFLCP